MEVFLQLSLEVIKITIKMSSSSSAKSSTTTAKEDPQNRKGKIFTDNEDIINEVSFKFTNNLLPKRRDPER